MWTMLGEDKRCGPWLGDYCKNVLSDALYEVGQSGTAQQINTRAGGLQSRRSDKWTPSVIFARRDWHIAAAIVYKALSKAVI